MVANNACVYIIYRPGTRGGKPQVFFNNEAKSVLFPPIPEGEKASLPEISSLCAKWKEILEGQGQDGIRGSADEGTEAKGYIDIFQSWRRRYTVRGVLLSEKNPITKKKEKSYLFIIERFKPESLNLAEVFRLWNLNHREQEIVRLILGDRGNKEIANHLGISINTVKAYMKLLLRKVGVHTRAGIISALLDGRKEE